MTKEKIKRKRGRPSNAEVAAREKSRAKRFSFNYLYVCWIVYWS